MKTERLIYIANYIYGYQRYIYREEDKMVLDTFSQMTMDIDRFNDFVLFNVCHFFRMTEHLVIAKDMVQEMAGVPNDKNR